MTTYLTIITTALVITQIIRVVQNYKQLKRTADEAQKEMDRLGELPKGYMALQARAFELIVKTLDRETGVDE